MPRKFNPALSYHVILVLAILADSSQGQGRQEGCLNHVVCEGHRPLLPSGCCPLQGGQRCHLEPGDECDSELGLNCVPDDETRVDGETGTCQGRYNLHAVSNTQSEIELRWSAFAPDHYMDEYVLLVKETTLDSDLPWEPIDCGIEASYTAGRLKPATVYFFRIGIWEDARSMILGTTTETLMTRTRAVEFCEHQRQPYPVNHTFIHECESNCTCMANGDFLCVPLCPERDFDVLPEGCRLIKGEECCDVRISCDPGGRVCELDGTVYPHGEGVEIGCRHCTCHDGQLECEYPDHCDVVRPSVNCSHPQAVEIEGECCPEWTCREMCVHEQQTYDVDEYFKGVNCSLCQCVATDSVQCTEECPPVEVPVPDIFCPDPHIRNDGCCDTLHCWNPTADDEDLVRNVYALSFSPPTLTLSFEVDAITEENGVALYCQYEVLFTNTSNALAPWQRRVVQPIDVRLQDQIHSVAHPSEVVTTESAIVVGDRAYVTLAGMSPDTRYYVKIRPLLADADDQQSAYFEHSKPKQAAATIVVKTKPLNDVTSCIHYGKEVPHNERVPGHCSQICTCRYGEIICKSICHEEENIIAASPSCPQPRLEKSGDDCCATWKCYPSGSGCHYNGLILGPGQSVTSLCHVCTCQNGTVQCTSRCPPVSAAPRAGCVLTNLTGHCCPQWKCHKEFTSPLGVESSILLRFRGPCKQPVSEFEAEVAQQVTSHVQEELSHVVDERRLKNLRDGLRVDTECLQEQRQNKSWRKKRSSGTGTDNDPVINVYVILHSNLSSQVVSTEAVDALYNTSLELTSLLNHTVQVQMENHEVLTVQSAQLHNFTFLCGQGFSQNKGSCVLSQLETNPHLFPGSSLQVVHVTSSSATLKLSPLDDKTRRHILSLVVEYRRPSDIHWLSTNDFLPSVTSQTLDQLSPNQEYVVRLMAVTHWVGKSRWTVAETRFRTQSYDASANTEWSLSVGEVSISDNHVILNWDPLPDVIIDQVTKMTVVYRLYSIRHFTQKLNVPDVRQTNIKIGGLEPGMSYVAELTLETRSRAVLHSHPVHFVTKVDGHTSEEMLMVVIASVSLNVALGLTVLVTCLLWRRSFRKKADNTFFNKTYGIRVTDSSSNTEPRESATSSTTDTPSTA